MTIQYALTRREIVSSFYASLSASPKYRATILTYYLLVGGLFALTGLAGHAGTKSILVRFLGGALGFAILQPILLFIRAKTATRSLTISEEGISTQIGQISGKLQWNQIGVVHENPSFVLIGRKNGNAFYIPNRAFVDSTQKTEFVRLAEEWITNLA